jgi:hypothetical protein
MVAIGGIADIVPHWHEIARSRMTQSGRERLRFAAVQTDPEPHFAGCWNPPIVTSYLAVHKDQILCKRYCKLGRRTLYSGHQQQRGLPYYKSQYEHG